MTMISAGHWWLLFQQWKTYGAASCLIHCTSSSLTSWLCVRWIQFTSVRSQEQGRKNKFHQKKKEEITEDHTKRAASDTALSAITTTGAMIHGRIHLGMSRRAINHHYCKTSVCASIKPARSRGVCWSLRMPVCTWRNVRVFQKP